MAQEYKEFRQKTVEDAITEACQSFMVTSDRLDYVVVDEGSRGFLGIKSRDAVIKARVKGEVVDDFSIEADQIKAVLTEDRTFGSVFEEEKSAKAEKPEKSAKNENAPARGKSEKHEKTERTGRSEKPARTEKPEKEKPEDPVTEDAANQDDAAEGNAEESANSAEETRRSGRSRHSRNRNRNKKKEMPAEEMESGMPAEAAPVKKTSRHNEKPLTPEQIQTVKEQADTFLHQVFNAMGMDVDIEYFYENNGNILTMSFNGDDMGVLIGKRGQTLDSLQYLVSLVVNKGLDSYVHVKADTENYRERRKKTLENLAKNVAAKVKRTRRPSSLEPMNPYERRIIHAALQGDRYVTTYSEGQEPYRKVVVAPKKNVERSEEE